MADLTKEELDYILFGLEEGCKYRIGWKLATPPLAIFNGYRFSARGEIIVTHTRISDGYFNDFATVIAYTREEFGMNRSVSDGSFVIEKVG
jgi:hypothetical protein